MDFTKSTISELLSGKNVFLTGGAGVGKTTITNEVIEHFEAEGKKVAKLASTGMAATLIGGQTLHSFLDLGIASNIIELEQRGKLNIAKKTKKLLANISLVVIDEISMVSASLLEMIALRLKQADYRGVLLVVGDFLQLPPIARAYQKIEFAFQSESWSAFAFKKIELKHIYRTDDEKFIALLGHVRFGRVDEAVHTQLNQFIKPLPHDLNAFTFLFGKNSSAAAHNKMQLSFIESELFIREVETIRHSQKVQDQEIERFLQDARIEKELALKVGAPVLFTRNAWNYFNGERGIVVNIDPNYVYVQKNDARVIKLERVAQSKTNWVEKKIAGEVQLIEEASFTLYQYPIKLAFAITIHKSQGMSIEDLIIETNEIFAPSQFYVALSRSCNPFRLILIAPSRQWYDLAYVDERALRFVEGSWEASSQERED